MATVTDVCRNMVEGVHGGLASAVVDITTGMLLGTYHLVPHFTPAYLDAVAAAAVEMFRGRTVKRVEELLSRQRGTPVQDSFEEIFIASTGVFHFMKLLREKQVIVVLVTRKDASQGMGWSVLRNVLPEMAASLP
ncbi:MAG: hypothetical protein FJZ47_20485 [Candidatus Tectomicrobia bacterium]|uniref:Uncharacterized protein n=1 Tax=Tectimicrobiota bacterium TaxID=2528274 RepID=A0A938B2I9_UNCTE|nr:hypothetical protein [Candidatus Tectomicrobia bacterium]